MMKWNYSKEKNANKFIMSRGDNYKIVSRQHYYEVKAIKNTVIVPKVMEMLNPSWSMFAGPYISKDNTVQNKQTSQSINFRAGKICRLGDSKIIFKCLSKLI